MLRPRNIMIDESRLARYKKALRFEQTIDQKSMVESLTEWKNTIPELKNLRVEIVDSLDGDLARARARDRDLDLALTLTLDRARDLALALDRALARTLARAYWFDIGWYARGSCVDTGAEFLLSAFEAGAWYGLFTNDAILVLTIPTISVFDSQNRLHAEAGVAFEWYENRLYYWHGVNVPESVILHPEAITLVQINSEDNAEVRRIMLERFGVERYILESGAEVMDDDPQFGTLYRYRLGGERRFAVYVTNRTPEPDGSFKKYMLRVDGRAYRSAAGKHAQAALASMLRLSATSEPYLSDWHDYALGLES